MTIKLLTEQPTIHDTAKVTGSQLGNWTDIGANSIIEDSIIGDYTYTAGDAQITYSEIGKFCSIASHVRIHPVNHPMRRVTQHHLTYRKVQYGLDATDDDEFFQWRKDHKVTVGHDVWIGHGATIMPGVSIGTGAVIGAGAVVTKDIPPYIIAVGVPARPLRERFPKEIAAELLEIAWWDWDRETLEKRYKDLNDVECFIKKYRKPSPTSLGGER
ncbi:DapH/DapD/GlmU-related protein [Bacillus canaveralius]|uniref:DapH/DapD/GlmU-related protein n=1 Tax=Bacillus canaveralius TaxID=1403243 RepID=UPI000F7848E9|nr:DapH/DapD/GlmU-related protein [Bacillus canaveralius]RSK55180.1 acetyltransferase [Bacillus canaveralius]